MLCPQCGGKTIINRTIMDYGGQCRLRLRICKECVYKFLTEEWAVEETLTDVEIRRRLYLRK